MTVVSRCLASSKFGEFMVFLATAGEAQNSVFLIKLLLKIRHFHLLAGQVQILYIFGFSELWLGRPTIHCFLIKLLFKISYFQPLAGQGQI